jgi:hypothetical protein
MSKVSILYLGSNNYVMLMDFIVHASSNFTMNLSSFIEHLQYSSKIQIFFSIYQFELKPFNFPFCYFKVFILSSRFHL